MSYKKIVIMTKSIIISAVLLSIVLVFGNASFAGTYLSSAHGNSTYGVKRTAAGFPDYTRGLCAHCHEMHASIDGVEPLPSSGGPSSFTLFYSNHVSQTDNFCFECHKEVGSYQSGGSILNRSYSYRAGGWNADTVNDVLESFSFTSPDTSHYLDDIVTFITGKWNYTADSNPCNACHNPHAAQGDPANAAGSAKTAGSRGWPVSRPSLHSSNDNNAWGLWGDGAGEKMSDYTTGYQAPYRFGGATYEPDGSVTSDASKLTDYVTFCTDCHDNANTISSTPLSRNLAKFNWNNEKHGGGTADNNTPVGEPDTCSNISAPYQSGTCGTYVLACTDCHEPHGSPNLFLVRREVNGTTVTVDTGTDAGPSGDPNTEWITLCDNCHDVGIGDERHDHPATVPGGLGGCSSTSCHGELGDEYRVCTECHSHGNNLIDAVAYGDYLF